MTFLEQLQNWFTTDQVQLITTLHDRIGALEQKVGTQIAEVKTAPEPAPAEPPQPGA